MTVYSALGWVDARSDADGLFREVPVAELRAEEEAVLAASLELDDFGQPLPQARPLPPPVEPFRYPTIPWDRDRLRSLSEPDEVPKAEPVRDLPEDWAAVRREVLKRDRYRCLRCGESKRLEGHHIRPRAQGGSDDFWNLMTLCFACHNYMEPGP